jgi:nicotinic acid mononucleotide adenylyltransferase
MCKLAFESLNEEQPASSKTTTQILVSDAERFSWEYALAAQQQLQPQQHVDTAQFSVGTASLLQYLHQAYPDTQFSFCLGADSYVELLQGKWREGSAVLELLGNRLVVFSRGRPHETITTTTTTATNDQYRHSFVTVPELSTISSTQVRACRDPEQLRTMVAPAVLAYIQRHSLYMFAATTAAATTLKEGSSTSSSSTAMPDV